ncbi:MAG: lipopolysaccharide export system permease protein, partial [Planctomycetota bacterium]
MTTRRHLPLFGRLDRQTAMLFIASFATAMLLVVGLFWILELAGKIDNFLEDGEDGGAVASGLIVKYFLFHLPGVFLQVAPFVTLLAGMFTLNQLLKKNEVIAVLAAGISVHRMLLPVFMAGLFVGLLMFVSRELITEYIAEPREALLAKLNEGQDRPVYSDLWLNDLAGSHVRMGTFAPKHDGQPAVITSFEASLESSMGYVQITAPSATWTGDHWQLENGIQRMMRHREEDRSEKAIDRLVGFEFTPRDALTAKRARDNPLELSFEEVLSIMSRDPDDVVYQTLLQYHLTFPLANLVLLLIGLPVALTHERGRGAERMAIGGMLCIVYFAVDFLFRSLGIEGTLSP